jgi:hypothetical protein
MAAKAASGTSSSGPAAIRNSARKVSSSRAGGEACSPKLLDQPGGHPGLVVAVGTGRWVDERHEGVEHLRLALVLGQRRVGAGHDRHCERGATQAQRADDRHRAGQPRHAEGVQRRPLTGVVTGLELLPQPVQQAREVGVDGGRREGAHGRPL